MSNMIDKLLALLGTVESAVDEANELDLKVTLYLLEMARLDLQTIAKQQAEALKVPASGLGLAGTALRQAGAAAGRRAQYRHYRMGLG
jgi:hypothetical protein